MAFIYISEFSHAGHANSAFGAVPLACPMLPALVEHKIEIGNSVKASLPLNDKTMMIRLHAEAACFIGIDCTQEEVAGTTRIDDAERGAKRKLHGMAANETRDYGVHPFHKLVISVLAA